MTNASAAGWLLLAQQNAGEMAWGSLLIGVIGGLAIFLYGMEVLAIALRTVAGERLRDLLAKLTYNRFTAVATGAGVTAIIQSSTVTTLLVVGFISAGAMQFQQSIGVIMGANIGTTVTAQVVAFKVTSSALILITIGVAVGLLVKNAIWKQYGAIALGLGLIFFGMNLMSQSTADLREYAPFIDFIARLENPLLGIMAGMILTVILNSSSATTGIVIALAAQGLVPLAAGIAIILGANIGTCATTLIASIGKPIDARRAAMVHAAFNIAGVMMWAGLTGVLATLTQAISPRHSELEGAARLAAEVPRQVANAHTIFNLSNTLVLIWFTGPLARFVTWLLPDRPVAEPERIRPKYLEKELLSTPAFALDRVRMEIGHLGDIIAEMIDRAPDAAISGTREDLLRVAARDDDVDLLHGEIISYLARINQETLSTDLASELNALLTIANTLEQIGDTIEDNLCARGFKRLKTGVIVSEETRRTLGSLTHRVQHAIKLAITAVVTQDVEPARAVEAMREEVQRLTDEATRHQAKRLIADAPRRVATYTVELDIIENLHRLYDFARRIAKYVPLKDQSNAGGAIADPPTTAPPAPEATDQSEKINSST